ncbi:MAG: hypothetical protein CL834_01895 [Crocinitomicaceae bacterium]|nr:hypothetical protein [Crocinitomicaceae bacterium]
MNRNKLRFSRLLWVIFFQLPMISSAQEAAFRWFVSEQVISGQWLSSEGEMILQYIETKGRPVIPEEAAAIVGLSTETRQQLYRAESWHHLCTGQNAANLKKRSDPSLDIRSQGNTRDSSVRLKNPGKWSLRFDGPLHGATMKDTQQNPISGYLQLPIGRGVRLLLGQHKLGWGNRLAQKEATFFSGLISPAFAVPVHYGFAPTWGNVSSGMRSGLACSGHVLNWEAVISGDGLFANSRWAGMLLRSLPWGSIGGTLERGWLRTGFGQNVEASWLGSCFGFGNSRGWQWSFELQPSASMQSFSIAWQRSLGREWDGFGAFKMRKGLIRDHENQDMTWRDEMDLSLGMQWVLGAGGVRFQFRMELASADHVLEHVVRSSLVAQLNSLNRIEMHLRWKGETTHTAVEDFEQRVGLRWRFEDAFFAGNIRLEWIPAQGRDGFGWACMWGGDLGQCNVKFGIARWKMGPHQVGYFSTPTFEGVRIQGMHHCGTRASFRISKKIGAKWKVQLLGFKSNANNPFERFLGLSTLAYAQSEIQFRLMLNL